VGYDSEKGTYWNKEQMSVASEWEEKSLVDRFIEMVLGPVAALREVPGAIVGAFE